MKVEISRLPWILVGISAALEGVTVAILPYVSSLPSNGPISKPPESGLLLGYIGMLTAILLVNAFGRTSISKRIAGGALHIEGAVFISLWGGLFLALIFFFQGVFDFTPYTTLTVMLRAACSLAASTLIVLLLYRVSARLVPWLSVRLAWGADKMADRRGGDLASGRAAVALRGDCPADHRAGQGRRRQPLPGRPRPRPRRRRGRDDGRRGALQPGRSGGFPAGPCHSTSRSRPETLRPRAACRD